MMPLGITCACKPCEASSASKMLRQVWLLIVSDVVPVTFEPGTIDCPERRASCWKASLRSVLSQLTSKRASSCGRDVA